MLDVFSRRAIGWSMGDRAETELVLRALDMAMWNHGPQPGVIRHSDHGSQYTSLAFTTRLKEAGIVGSIGTVGDALDNAVAESFFATLQTELLDRGRGVSTQAGQLQGPSGSTAPCRFSVVSSLSPRGLGCLEPDAVLGGVGHYRANQVRAVDCHTGRC